MRAVGEPRLRRFSVSVQIEESTIGGQVGNMTREDISTNATGLPSCSSGDGVLQAMALMAEHKVRTVLVRDQSDAITGLFRLHKDRVQFEPVGS
jgi:hypothetical protein